MDIAEWLVVAAVALGMFGFGYLFGLRRHRPSRSQIVVPVRARTLLRALPHAVVVVGGDGHLYFSNDKARELGLGLTTGVVTAPLGDLAGRAINRGERVEAVTSVRRRHALSDTQLLAMATPVVGEDLAVLSVFDAGSAAAARTAHRDFVVNVSHELKTPIGALSLMAEALETAADEPSTVREFARKISRESERMKVLVEQFIELSRVQSSETVVDGRPMDVAECILDAVEAVQSLAQSRHVAIDTSSVQSAMVSCERRSVTMALRNLVENAVRYSPEQARVSVTTRIDGDAVELSVKDQGIGIGPVDLPRIFDRFYRADEARDRDSGGTGIGLAIVKHVARQHGGRVRVWSEPGVGSTFTLVLPTINTEP